MFTFIRYNKGVKFERIGFDMQENDNIQATEKNTSTENFDHSAEQTYTPPTETVPTYKYNYSQPAEPAQAPKKKKSRAGLVALAVVAAILISALSGIGGTLLATHFMMRDDTPLVSTDGDDKAPEGGTQQGADGSDTQSNVTIVKNDESVTVTTVKGSIGDENLTIPDVVALVKDTVVEISTETAIYNGRYVTSGAGSGVIIAKDVTDGKKVYIVTNHHVIESADTIKVRLTDGREYTASLCGTDSASDIAVLAIETDGINIKAAEMGSSDGLVVGETVVAIGNPLGELGGTVTNGIISALAREVEIGGSSMTLLQTNAAVNPGNSGGGLFNIKGELIGIVNAKSSGENIDNIGFAIPVDTAHAIISELISLGYVTGRVDAGLSVLEISDMFTAFQYGVSSMGVYVTESKYSDEIMSGDRIVAVNGSEISSASDIKVILGQCKVGDTITIRISRNRSQIDVNLTLREYVPATAKTE